MTFMGPQTGQRVAHHPAPAGSEATWVPDGCNVTSAPLERKNHYIHEILGMLTLMHNSEINPLPSAVWSQETS